MKAMRLHEIGKFTLDEVEVPEPQGREILVKVDACGICGSDIPRVYELGTKVYPVTLGHEYVGTVVSVGNDEDQELIGKTGAVYPVVPCMECPSCRIGQYAQCESYKNLGSRTDGGFAEYRGFPRTAGTCGACLCGSPCDPQGGDQRRGYGSDFRGRPHRDPDGPLVRNVRHSGRIGGDQ